MAGPPAMASRGRPTPHFCRPGVEFLGAGTLSEPEELAGRLQSLSAIPVTCWGLAQAAVSGLRGLLSLKFPGLRFSQGGWTRPGA